ncbi:flagellar motor switch protein FliN [Bosea sp. (in: a-proteobacteria)]|jgi:flagellar motor switch protein FliN/FliY|uniref:flagellar motor switch protein FliN n=1 Tax=Bosea sp. (in: a-proteobacteria) TaxID=1871050 RepID=UPI003F7047BE
MSQENDLNLPPLNPADLSFDHNSASVARSGPVPVKTAEDLEQVFDVPVTVSAVLGSSRIAVGDLLQIAPGTVLELDRRVGEAIDIFVNERLVARGEVVVVEDRLGVTMTEIIKADR